MSTRLVTVGDPDPEPDHRERVTVYSASLVIPVTAPVIVNGAVAVKGSRVVHVGTRSWVMQELKGTPSLGKIEEKHWDGILMPGLVNAHTHLQYSGMAEVGKGQYKDFHSWEKAFNLVYDNPNRPHAWRSWAMEGARQAVETGTTAAADIVTDLDAAAGMVSQGMHGITYWEVMGWANKEWEDRGKFRLNLQLHRLREEHVSHLGISPHAPYTLDAEPFVDLPDIARRLNMRLHIHLAETPLEAGSETLESQEDKLAALMSGRTWVSYRELKREGLGLSAIRFVDQLGSLGPDVHIAHGVWADEEDRRILRQRQVYVALCPRSNSITNTGKEAPVSRYLKEGNDLCLGTDSLSSSPSLDLMDESAALYKIARQQGYGGRDLPRRIIHMMTLNGAAAMGQHLAANRIGQINAGALADLAFMDIPIRAQNQEGIEEALEELVASGGGHNRATLISGRMAYNADIF